MLSRYRVKTTSVRWDGSYGVSHLRTAQNREKPTAPHIGDASQSVRDQKVRRLRVTRLYAGRVRYRNECARPFARVIQRYLIDSRSTAAIVHGSHLLERRRSA